MYLLLNTVHPNHKHMHLNYMQMSHINHRDHLNLHPINQNCEMILSYSIPLIYSGRYKFNTIVSVQ